MTARPHLDDEEEVKTDMTPMIDLIFLLLVFFILTTKFIPEEKIITSMMPTDKGQINPLTKPPLVPEEEGNILIYPARMERGLQPSQYDADWHANPQAQYARLKFNQVDEGYKISLATMTVAEGAQLETAIGEIHQYITQHLNDLEDPSQSANRGKQAPITIHCFSGMPWSVALVAYDAVRAYESTHINQANLSHDELLGDPKLARSVTFAPPRLRGYRNWEMGYELNEIIHTR